MLTRPDASLRWDVLEEHFDESCFLWSQWEHALCSHAFTLGELASGDEARLHAHLRALVVGGGRVAERLLIPALEEDDLERLRSASYVLLSEGEGQRVEQVCEAFISAPRERRPSFLRALALSECRALSKHLQPLLATPDAELLTATTELLAFRRSLPLDELSRLCRHEVPRVRAVAQRAAGAMQAPVDTPTLQAALQSPHSMLRAAGLELGLLQNRRAARQSCEEWLDVKEEPGQLARLAVALGGERSQLERLLSLLEDVPDLRREILWALGFSGRRKAAEACLRWLGDPDLGCIAAEAFCGITGLVLTDEYREEPSGGGGDEDQEADPLAHEAGLERPAPRAIERWWAEVRGRFDADARYLGGRGFSLDVLLAALTSAPMRRRPVLALELAIRTQGQYQVEVRDFSHVQAWQMEQARAARGRFWTGPFSARMSQ